MDQLRKDQIKQTMIDVLTKNVNYPNCDGNAILSQVKNMWVALEDKGLTTGLSFQAFQQTASSHAMMEQMKSVFGL
jgi:hypothetical protein